MIFRDREDAGRRLAKLLGGYAKQEMCLVLGVPRGGVVVAFEIAMDLHLPLDIFLSKKLGVPGREELAFGAIAADGERFLDRQLVRSAGISEDQIESISEEAIKKLRAREVRYRGARARPVLEDKTVILVDDGIATGASIYASVCALRLMKPRKLVVAVPVAPNSSCDWLAPLTDEFVCLLSPDSFYAVGQFYRNFDQVEDETVVDLLGRAGDQHADQHTDAGSGSE